MTVRTALFALAAALLLAGAGAARAKDPAGNSLRFSMPKGWTVAADGTVTAADLRNVTAALGHSPVVKIFAAKPVVAKNPALWREWVEMASYERDDVPAETLKETVVREAIRSCGGGLKKVNINEKSKGGVLARGGYIVCAKLKTLMHSQVMMYKVVEGTENVFLLRRLRRANPLPASSAPDLAREFPKKMQHWLKWYKSVRVVAKNTLEKARTGSAFAIHPRFLLTNEHVVKNCKEVRVAGAGKALLSARDKAADLALLRTGAPNASIARFGGADEIRLGSPVMVAGYPLGDQLGNSLTVTTGTINGHGGLRGREGMVRFDAAVQKGNSGGPLLGQSGNVIGVVRGILDPGKAQNVNFAITVPVVETFLKRHHVAYETAAPGAPLSPPDIADKAKAFTVQVECWR
jgi:S1-C subfamily serine protease